MVDLGKLLDAQARALALETAKEQESLIARYILETGLKPSEIVLIQRDTNEGRRIYPAPREPKFDDEALEIRRLKDENALLRDVAKAAQRYKSLNRTSRIMCDNSCGCAACSLDEKLEKAGFEG